MKRIDFSNGTHTYAVESAGLGDEAAMHFDPGIIRCGQITNGVAFNIGRGSWVIPVEELREMLRLAEEARETLAQRNTEE